MSSVIKDSKLRPSTLDARRTLIIWGNLTEATWRNRKYILYGMLRERSGWTKSRAVIGYPSGQNGAIWPARDYPPCRARKKFPLSQIINLLLTKLFRSRTSRWLEIRLVLFVFCEFIDFYSKKREKRIWPISSHLDLTLSQLPIFKHIYCCNNHTSQFNFRGSPSYICYNFRTFLSHQWTLKVPDLNNQLKTRYFLVDNLNRYNSFKSWN